MGKLMVGAAKVDISPDRFPVHTSDGRELTGIHDPLHVRVVAIANGDDRLVFIGSAFRWEEFQPELEVCLARHGVSPENTVVFRTGSHNSPVIPENGIVRPEKYREEAYRNLEIVKNGFIRAVDEAFERMVPARYGYGCDKCFINCERCYTTVNGYAHEVCRPGVPIDRTMQIVKFEDLTGKPIAALLNYDLLASSLMLARDVDGEYKITDDLPGFACDYIERHMGNDFIVAWIDGASGNVWMAHNSVFYDDDEMPQDFDYVDGALFQIVKAQAQEGAMVALKILRGITCSRDSAVIRRAKRRTWLPGQEQLPPLRRMVNVNIAHMNGIYPGDDHVRMRGIIEKNGGVCPLMPGEEYPPKLIVPKPSGEKIPVDMVMFLFDDISFFIPEGHYFSGTGKRCKEESRTPVLMIMLATVLSDSFTNHGYIYLLDDEHKDVLSFERVHSKAYPGHANDTISQGMLDLFDDLGVTEKTGEVVFYYE